jgi:hypothetical protein
MFVLKSGELQESQPSVHSQYSFKGAKYLSRTKLVFHGQTLVKDSLVKVSLVKAGSLVTQVMVTQVMVTQVLVTQVLVTRVLVTQVQVLSIVFSSFSAS